MWGFGMNRWLIDEVNFHFVNFEYILESEKNEKFFKTKNTREKILSSIHVQ